MHVVDAGEQPGPVALGQRRAGQHRPARPGPQLGVEPVEPGPAVVVGHRLAPLGLGLGLGGVEVVPFDEGQVEPLGEGLGHGRLPGAGHPHHHHDHDNERSRSLNPPAARPSRRDDVITGRSGALTRRNPAAPTASHSAWSSARSMWGTPPAAR